MVDKFPALDNWFSIRVDVDNPYNYTRYDLCLKPGVDLDDIANQIASLIARLRLSKSELEVWEKSWTNCSPIPDDWKCRIQHRFWRGFVSNKATEDAGGKIKPDEMALQGHIGELILYIIQYQMQNNRIDAVPRRPKDYSKDSGIDCLELCGERENPRSLHYIVWESKGITGDTLGGYTRKIYNQHKFETPKVFAEAVDQLSDLHGADPVLSEFIGEMIDDFYTK